MVSLAKTLLSVVLMLAACSTHAAQVHFAGAIGYEAGGDDLLEVLFTNGDSMTISAGDGLFVNAGAAVTLNRARTTQAIFTLGWKFQSVIASNGDATLSRFPLEAMVAYAPDKHRFGAGITTHLGIDLSGSGLLSEVGTDLESDVGYLLQYDYRFGKRATVGVRYVDLTYKATEVDQEVDASSFGLLLTTQF